MAGSDDAGEIDRLVRALRRRLILRSRMKRLVLWCAAALGRPTQPRHRQQTGPAADPQNDSDRLPADLQQLGAVLWRIDQLRADVALRIEARLEEEERAHTVPRADTV
jgi:hypothetical protein